MAYFFFILSVLQSYLTLLYVTSLRVSFCLGTFAYGFIMLPPRSLVYSRACSLAIRLITRVGDIGNLKNYSESKFSFTLAFSLLVANPNSEQQLKGVL